MEWVHGEATLSQLTAPASAATAPVGVTGGDLVRGGYLTRWLGPLGFAGPAARPSIQARISARAAPQAGRVGALTLTSGDPIADLLRTMSSASAPLAPGRVGALVAAS